MGDVSLGEAMVNLVRDVDGPLRLVISALCYILAFCFFVSGCLRLVKAGEDKFHAPSGWGTALSFVTAVVLVSLPGWIGAFSESLFGTTRPAVSAVLGYGSGSDAGARYDVLLAAVFTVVNLVGLIALLRGVVMMRAAADGRPGATAGRSAAHILGGLMAWHIVAVIEALQNTLGLEVLRVG